MELSSVNNVFPVNLGSDGTGPRPVPEEQRELIRAVKAVNASGQFGEQNELTFVLDRNTRQAVVRIVNRDTHELVEQIPAEYVLRMAEELNRG